MAKKTKKETKEFYVGDPEDEHVEKTVVKTPKVETPKRKEPSKTIINDWEVKDRMYYLKGYNRPLSYQVRSSGIYYFDREKGYERELKNTSNQRTCFVDEMIGDQRLEHIVFRNGYLLVPENKVILQKLLSLYHPHKDVIYYEFKPEKIAVDQLDDLNMQVEAMAAARNLEINKVEAIMRVEIGSSVSNMSSKELKRDCLLFARKKPKLFLELINDENVELRNVGIKATEMGIIKLSKNNRTFSWASNGRDLMNVPFDEHPYSALAAWFKTDEGMEIYQNIEKRLK